MCEIIDYITFTYYLNEETYSDLDNFPKSCSFTGIIPFLEARKIGFPQQMVCICEFICEQLKLENENRKTVPETSIE